MFLKIVRAAGGKGVKHEYVRLVQSYREDGKPKQRVVCNLGRKDLLAAHLDSLNRLLGGEPASGRDKDLAEQIKEADSWNWGPMLAARSLWRELGLEEILDRLGGRGNSDGVVMSDRALVLVANRLCAPTSEHGLARWMETDFVCDRQGRRWVPPWREDEQRLGSPLPRVRVELRWLKQWYRTLDQLHARKQQIEKELFLRLRDLFSLEVDLVFYDLTSTYFEGKGPAGLGAHGHSREGRPRNRQVLVGLVMVDGWPIAHHVFAGNWRDAKTVPKVLEDLRQRFGLRRVVFVGDRGMVTSDNLKLLRSKRQGYLVGLQRRRREKIYRYMERATGEWIECPGGITARDKAEPAKTLVQEVDSEQPGVRIFVVHSDERLGFEREQRLKAMQRVQEAFERLERRVGKGQLKAAEKVGAAAARIQARHHGYRYYDWEYKDGRFRFFEHPVNLKREQAYEGKYVIQTEEKNLSAAEAVRIYKELSEIERAFMNLKDVIEMRPIFHQRPERVEAHLFVAALAFLLHRAMEKKLKAAGLDLSATEALQAVHTVRVIDLELINKKTKRVVTRGTARAKVILSALGITDRNPPRGGRDGVGTIC
ncbi:MAG: IS1634 family transposase [Anaerolineae bacterium]